MNECQIIARQVTESVPLHDQTVGAIDRDRLDAFTDGKQSEGAKYQNGFKSH